MKEIQEDLQEESVIFFSVVKWLFLSTLTGILVGFSTSIFLKILDFSIKSTSKYSWYFLLLPVGFFLSSLIIKVFAPDAKGHGTEKVIEAVHKYSGIITIRVIPVKLIATVITIASGGSVGKEGPSAQIGAGLSSAFATLLRFDNPDRIKLVVCGISAGFAAVFGTPVAGAIFGIEVLSVGKINYSIILPSFTAGITAYQVTNLMNVHHFHSPLEFTPVFSNTFFLTVVIAGVFFGICSFLLIEVNKNIELFSEKIRIWEPYKGLIGGIFLVFLTIIFSTDYLGLGLNVIENSLSGKGVIWYAFLLKILFTAVTLNFGGSGGILTPIFFIGATAGAAYAQFFGFDIPTFAALGLVALLGGSANTPIASSIMAMELFGSEFGSYASIACIISFLMTGHRSVYPSQRLAFKKSNSIEVQLGSEMDDVHPRFTPKSKVFIGLIKVAKEQQENIRNLKVDFENVNFGKISLSKTKDKNTNSEETLK